MAIQQMDNAELADLYGEPEDVETAQRIIKQSLKMAASAIKKQELFEVTKYGLMSQSEVDGLSKLKQAQENKNEQGMG